MRGAVQKLFVNYWRRRISGIWFIHLSVCWQQLSMPTMSKSWRNCWSLLVMTQTLQYLLPDGIRVKHTWEGYEAIVHNGHQRNPKDFSCSHNLVFLYQWSSSFWLSPKLLHRCSLKSNHLNSAIISLLLLSERLLFLHHSASWSTSSLYDDLSLLLNCSIISKFNAIRVVLCSTVSSQQCEWQWTENTSLGYTHLWSVWWWWRWCCRIDFGLPVRSSYAYHWFGLISQCTIWLLCNPRRQTTSWCFFSLRREDCISCMF